jgi:multicomponent Na+:H+ antiporter subunit B
MSTGPLSPPPARQRLRRRIESRAEMTVMVRTIIRALLPIVLVFGVYIITYGHLTPGGGFQGGMILVGGVMSFYLAYGYDVIRRFNDETLDLAEHVGALLYVIVGLAGLAAGAAFLTNIIGGGAPGTLLSSGIVLVLDFVVGFKVAAGTLIVLLILLEALRKGA